MKITSTQVPIVSIHPLVHQDLPSSSPTIQETCKALLEAAKTWGFIYISDHGVPPTLLSELESLSRTFFSLPLEKKMKIRMLLGGSAWRGYFPPGGELTSGIPDAKEGIYFGSELPPGPNPLPLHGPNLWPEEEDCPGLKPIVLEYISRLTTLGHVLMRALAIGLELEDSEYFKKFFGNDPTILFRIFNYPQSTQKEGWGVGEHTDYGFLTILKTDEHPGLQVLGPDGSTWIDAPPVPGTFIINLGDQLEISTKGLLKATPHRVKIQRNGDRLSFPFFFDPDWDFKLEPVPVEKSRVLRAWVDEKQQQKEEQRKRWDGKDLTSDEGRKYGEYLLQKVEKCFPELFDKVV